MESILEMIQGLITRFFGSSAMSVVQSFIDKIIGIIGSIFGSLKPAARYGPPWSSPRRRSIRSPSCHSPSGPLS